MKIPMCVTRYCPPGKILLVPPDAGVTLELPCGSVRLLFKDVYPPTHDFDTKTGKTTKRKGMYG